MFATNAMFCFILKFFHICFVKFLMWVSAFLLKIIILNLILVICSFLIKAAATSLKLQIIIVEPGKIYTEAPGEFAPEMQNRALENKKRAPENRHRLQAC